MGMGGTTGGLLRVDYDGRITLGGFPARVYYGLIIVYFPICGLNSPGNVLYCLSWNFYPGFYTYLFFFFG